MTDEDRINELAHAIEELAQENDSLKFRIANSCPESEENKQFIAELNGQIKALSASLEATKSMRDTLQRENAELKRQCSRYQHQLKKVA